MSFAEVSGVRTMTAVVPARAGEPDVLQVVRRPTPGIGRHDVLITVAAAGVNRADLMQRAGLYPLPADATDVPGLEVSGTVAAVGAEVDPALLGSEVCALLSGGGYAEQVAVCVDHVLPVPRGVSLVDAAGLVEVAATVWSNVFMPTAPTAGSWVLVHGGGGGVGSLAVQVAASQDLLVATTVGSDSKVEVVRRLGAEVVINHRRQDFVAELDRRGISPALVLDVVGADYLRRNLSVLAPGGRLAMVGHQSGADGMLDLALMLRRSLTISGTGLRLRPAEEKTEILRQVRTHVWPLYEDGTISPTTFASYSFAQAAAAHRLVEESGHVGKVLLRPS